MTNDRIDRPLLPGDIVKINGLPDGYLEGLSETESEFAKASVGKSAIVDEVTDDGRVRIYLYDDAGGTVQHMTLRAENVSKRSRGESPRLKVVSNREN